jgi:hypothetical protein
MTMTCYRPAEITGDCGTCPDGWKAYCCTGNSYSSSCKFANNNDCCTVQYGNSYAYGWCTPSC